MQLTEITSSIHCRKLSWLLSAQLHLLDLSQGIIPYLVIEITWQGGNDPLGAKSWVLNPDTNMWSSSRKVAPKLGVHYTPPPNLRRLHAES